MLNTRNGKRPIAGGTMDYVRFGRGKEPLINLPCLGDSLRSIMGTALSMAMIQRTGAISPWQENL